MFKTNFLIVIGVAMCVGILYANMLTAPPPDSDGLNGTATQRMQIDIQSGYFLYLSVLYIL